MSTKIQPMGYRYEKNGTVSLTAKPSRHYRDKGWEETVLYPGPTVEAVANELLASRKREVDMAQTLGNLCLAIVNKLQTKNTE